MRLHEIDPEIAAEIVAEAKPTGSMKPLTPEQMRARKKRQDKAAANVQDVQDANAVRLRKARRRLGDA